MDLNVLYHGHPMVATRFWATGEPCLQVTLPEHKGLPHVEFAGGYPNEYYVFLRNLSAKELRSITDLDGQPIDLPLLGGD